MNRVYVQLHQEFMRASNLYRFHLYILHLTHSPECEMFHFECPTFFKRAYSCSHLQLEISSKWLRVMCENSHTVTFIHHWLLHYAFVLCCLITNFQVKTWNEHSWKLCIMHSNSCCFPHFRLLCFYFATAVNVNVSIHSVLLLIVCMPGCEENSLCALRRQSLYLSLKLLKIFAEFWARRAHISYLLRVANTQTHPN